MTITFGSLFAGGGGLDLGLERAGWKCRWQVEIDPYATGVLARHWPDVPRHGDILGVDSNDLDDVDAICLGFPCNNLSTTNTSSTVAGRHGLQGPKSGLWFQAAQIIAEVGPKWVVIENVARSWKRWVPSVRRHLWSIGYASLPLRVSARCLGAHHERSRLFVIAHANRDPKPLLAIDAEASMLRPIAVADGDWRGAPPGGWRMAHGVPHRMDRNRVIGMAVMPGLAELVGRLILPHSL